MVLKVLLEQQSSYEEMPPHPPNLEINKTQILLLQICTENCCRPSNFKSQKSPTGQ